MWDLSKLCDVKTGGIMVFYFHFVPWLLKILNIQQGKELAFLLVVGLVKFNTGAVK